MRATSPSLLSLAALFGTLACDGGGPRPFPPVDPDLAAANEAAGDPYRGRFPMEEALAGLPAEGRLHATLSTAAGDIHCRLDPGHAPLTVANFVGLARGLRPWLDGDTWVRAPFYDGTTFHRAEENQFVQAGRRGDRESAGFNIQDEISAGDDFERGGMLAMANEGAPGSGSAQFFITTGDVSHLEGVHTIFGECEDDAVVRELARRANAGQQPALRTIRVERR